jgi:hypothetical protein
MQELSPLFYPGICFKISAMVRVCTNNTHSSFTYIAATIPEGINAILFVGTCFRFLETKKVREIATTTPAMVRVSTNHISEPVRGDTNRGGGNKVNYSRLLFHQPAYCQT